MEDTKLVNRASAGGVSKKTLIAFATFPLPIATKEPPIPEALREALVPERNTMHNLLQPSGKGRNQKLSGPDLLDVVSVDIFNDICGKLPLSGLNCVSSIVKFIIKFYRFESELNEL